MSHKCDKCDKPATIHLTEIHNGQKIEKHLCEECAAEEGITVKSDMPISQLLEDFVLHAAGLPTQHPTPPEAICDICGLSFSDFRQNGLLGCPNDYVAFESLLLPLLAEAQDGATEHLGKAPAHADEAQRKQSTILRLRGELKKAINAEAYEQAARLRDEIKRIESE